MSLLDSDRAAVQGSDTESAEPVIRAKIIYADMAQIDHPQANEETGPERGLRCTAISTRPRACLKQGDSKQGRAKTYRAAMHGTT